MEKSGAFTITCTIKGVETSTKNLLSDDQVQDILDGKEVGFGLSLPDENTEVWVALVISGIE